MSGRARSRYSVLAVLAVCIAGCLSLCVVDALAATPSGHAGRAATGQRALAPGLKLVISPSACPASDRHLSGAGARTQARHDELVPPKDETGILICRYNGMKNPPPFFDPRFPAFHLIAHHSVISPALRGRFVHALNSVRAIRKGAVYSCPVDFAANVVAYYEMRNGTSYRYVIDTGGCNEITSGTVWRLGLDAPFIDHMLRLTPAPKYGTVAGKLVICTAANGQCARRVTTPAICDPVCSGQEEIALITPAGKTVARATVTAKNRFTAHVAAGRYKLVPINVPGKGIQPQSANARRAKPVWVTVRDGKRTHATVYVRRSEIKLGSG